jgi:hypothetical protein
MFSIILSYISLGLSILSVASLFYYEDNLSLYYQKDVDSVITLNTEKHVKTTKSIQLNTNPEDDDDGQHIEIVENLQKTDVIDHVPSSQKQWKQNGLIWKFLFVIWRYSEIVNTILFRFFLILQFHLYSENFSTKIE